MAILSNTQSEQIGIKNWNTENILSIDQKTLNTQGFNTSQIQAITNIISRLKPALESATVKERDSTVRDS